MKEINLLIPTLESEQNIDIEVRINGKRRCLRYRVEIISWDEHAYETEDKVEVLRRVIREYDKSWQLIQIGAPSDTSIPIMFRQRGEERPGAQA